MEQGPNPGPDPAQAGRAAGCTTQSRAPPSGETRVNQRLRCLLSYTHILDSRPRRTRSCRAPRMDVMRVFRTAEYVRDRRADCADSDD
jgi:hypothetical protein